MGQRAGARADTAAFSDKKKLDIEALLQWAFLEELPKRALNATGETWDRLAQYGFLGGVDIDEPAAMPQRYAYVGEPHADAIAIERAVTALGSRPVNWERDFFAIAGELAPLLDINGMGGIKLGRFRAGAPDSGFTREQLAARTEMREFTHHAAGKFRVGLRVSAAAAPRDVLHVASINIAALVVTHAVKRTRPDYWANVAPVPLPVHAGRGGGFSVVGECRGHNLYTAGSYCPLRWAPSPLQIALARADYLLWHEALATLAKTLGTLTAHEPLLPAAPTTPWLQDQSDQKKPRSFKQDIAGKDFLLRDAERPRAGAPNKKPRNSKVRHIAFDKGAKA